MSPWVTVASSPLTGAPLPDCKTTEASLPSLSLLGGFPLSTGCVFVLTGISFKC